MLSCRFSCVLGLGLGIWGIGMGIEGGVLRDRLYCMYALTRPLSTCDVDMGVVDCMR